MTNAKVKSNRLCKGCGKNFPRKIGTGWWCSTECALKNPKAKKRCKPVCSQETLRQREVTFRDGGMHLQQYCTVCKFTDFLPRQQRVQQAELVAVTIKKSLTLRERYSASFYNSPQWLALRYQALRLYGNRCMACRATDKPAHVDHIKPRSKYRHLELVLENLQVLCADCNLGKSNTDEIDWREK